MNDRAAGLHAAAEDERNRHARETRAQTLVRAARELEARRINALVGPGCLHLAADSMPGHSPGVDGTGFSDGLL